MLLWISNLNTFLFWCWIELSFQDLNFVLHTLRLSAVPCVSVSHFSRVLPALDFFDCEFRVTVRLELLYQRVPFESTSLVRVNEIVLDCMLLSLSIPSSIPGANLGLQSQIVATAKLCKVIWFFDSYDYRTIFIPLNFKSAPKNLVLAAIIVSVGTA